MTVDWMMVEPNLFLSLPYSLPYGITVEPSPFLIVHSYPSLPYDITVEPSPLPIERRDYSWTKSILNHSLPPAAYGCWDEYLYDQ